MPFCFVYMIINEQWRSQDFSERVAIGSLKRHFLLFEGTFEQNI